jgi:hypothetical protein
MTPYDVKTHNQSVFFFLFVAIRLAAEALESGLTPEGAGGDGDKSVRD